MKEDFLKAKKGAASIYIVIFTTTLLGVIALSFVRIMLAESLRTTNYSLSQSAYNSALAGIEDAKIVLLRNQNCVNNGSYTKGGTKQKSSDCGDYIEAFDNEKGATETAKSCDTVGQFLHDNKKGATETVIQTSDKSDNYTDAIDQAYTCVKISTYTDDFLAVLKEDASTKIIPLRSDSNNKQSTINRIRIQWFDKENYETVYNAENGLLSNGYSWMKNGNLVTNQTPYSGPENPRIKQNVFLNQFGSDAIIAPPLQVTFMQTADSFSVSDFYASVDDNHTNRGTLLLRPSSDNVHGDISNFLPTNALAYSANKSFNTPIDVHCASDPGDMGGDWGSNYACTAEFHVPRPINGDNSRNMNTTFLIVSLPYSKPTTDIAVKMYDCADQSISINDQKGCTTVKFANVQPMVDSTGRANDLFRRVESRIELADTSFPISNYALASNDSDGYGVQKNFYVTKKNCNYSSSKGSNGKVYGSSGTNEMTYLDLNKKNKTFENPGDRSCYSASGANGENKMQQQ